MKLIDVLCVAICVLVMPAMTLAEEPMTNSSEFAINLYRQLDAGDGNVFFSPLSIRAALAMTSAGAKGKTAEEMQNVLRLSGRDPHAGMSALLDSLSSEPKKDEDSKLVLRIANAVWGQKGYPFNPEFVAMAQKSYHADAKSVDFADASNARKQINDWVEEKTNKKIVDLIPDGALKPDTKLVLTNAVYFNARWAEEFSKSSTSDQPFHVSSGKTATLPTMRHTARYEYAETDQTQAIQLAYAGHETSMLILVPKSIDGLGKLQADLSAKQLADTIKSLQYRQIDLSLPRFKIEQSASLAQPLKAIGMKLAFDAEQADFSGMCTAERLYIGDVLHKASVKVDEEGTEAAAATAVMMRTLAAPMPEEPLRVQIDRPFVFMIRHEKTGEILFMGRVMNPAG